MVMPPKYQLEPGGSDGGGGDVGPRMWLLRDLDHPHSFAPTDLYIGEEILVLFYGVIFTILIFGN